MQYWKNTNIEDLEGEVWKSIKDYEELYEVSNKGRVKSLARKSKTKINKKDIILKQKLSYNGYLQVKLTKESKIWMPIVSRLVALAFLEIPDFKCVVNHKDCIRDNNILENLELVSQSQNIRYSYEIGNQNQTGTNNNNSKVTEDIVRQIRTYYKDNNHLSQKEIGEHFGLKREHIKDIISYKTWKHVK